MLCRVRRSRGLLPAGSRLALAVATLAVATLGAAAIARAAVTSAAVSCAGRPRRAASWARDAVAAQAGRLSAAAQARRGAVRRQAAVAARHPIGRRSQRPAAGLKTVRLRARTGRLRALAAGHAAAVAGLHSVRRHAVRWHAVWRQAVARQHATGTALTGTALTGASVLTYALGSAALR
jgi:hypothetical protein